VCVCSNREPMRLRISLTYNTSYPSSHISVLCLRLTSVTLTNLRDFCVSPADTDILYRSWHRLDYSTYYYLPTLSFTLMAPFGSVAKCSSAVLTGTPQTVSTPYTCCITYHTNRHHLFCCFFRAEGLRDYFQQFAKVYYPVFSLVPLILT
jgi:hypothetical protein